MSRDLERLVESLITDVSCYGDLGCTVSHVLESLSTFYKDARPRQDASTTHFQLISPEADQLLWSTAWDWLRVRKDISVGPNRKWNHLALPEILAIPDPDSQDGSSTPEQTADMDTVCAAPGNSQHKNHGKQPVNKDMPRKRPRIYVSEDRMWESIAGHAPDYRRVPRLEWMALVGIASTKQQGILQGDLGRLVGQDKRSLPKRTDALAEKGYISKRTTLVRGTKTSKLWLTRFAPALPTDPLKATTGLPTTVDMSRDALARDLEPVPWRGRWVGDSVDYISLAQTIMAIVKAYRIIRYHDLRCKLGILGLRWQMKVAAKTCRFFVRTGAIQYVGATLSGKLFKDCLKFDHDLTHEDWAAYLATGKQKASTGHSDPGYYTDNGIGPSRPAPGVESLDPASESRDPNKKRVSSRSKWTADKPLTPTVFDNISAAGPLGLSNKQIGDSTLGPSFRRYLSSISATLAIPTLQPPHLTHFQVVSEMHRKGKSQQYRYYAEKLRGDPKFTPSAKEDDGKGATDGQSKSDAINEDVSRDGLLKLFTASAILPDNGRAALGLAALAEVAGKGASSGVLKRKAEVLGPPQEGENRGVGFHLLKRKRVREESGNDEVAPEDDSFSPRSSLEPAPEIFTISTRRGTRRRRQPAQETNSLIVTLKCKPARLAGALRSEPTTTDHPVSGTRQSGVKDADDPAVRTRTEYYVDSDALLPKEAAQKDIQADEVAGSLGHADVQESIIVAHGSPDPNRGVEITQAIDKEVGETPVKRDSRRKPRGGKKPSGRGGRDGVFKCEKCGRTYKNDVGIKYHLERSHTPCNPSYVPPPSGTAPPLILTTRRPGPARRVVAPRQIKSRHSNLLIIDDEHETDVSVLDGEQSAADHSVEDSNVVSGDIASFIAAAARPSISLSATKRAEKKKVTSLPTGSKPPSNLRPEVASVVTSMSGLINDAEMGVRDMPAEHMLAQPTTRRSRLDDTIKLDAVHAPPNHRGLAPVGASESEELFTSAATKFRSDRGRRSSSSGPAKQNLKQDLGCNSPATDLGEMQASSADIARRPHAAAMRSNLTDNGHLASSDSETMERAIIHMLRANGGVFPGGQAVWYGILAVWETAFPSEPAPDHQRYKDALSKLAKRKQIVVSTHAFKDARGMMANYQLMRIPGVEASSPAGVAVKTNITAEHPKVYIPTAFTPRAGIPEEGKHNAQPVFSSRRRLVQGIEVLDAPFYAKKAADERPPTPPEGTSHTPRKRRRRMVTKEQLAQAEDEGPDGARKRDIFRLFMDGDKGPAGKPLASSGDGKGGFVNRLVFLSPNTYLGQEVPEDVRRALIPDLPDPEPTYPASLVDNNNAKEEYEVEFTNVDVILGRNGTWPAFTNKFFEAAEDCSITLSGWMPDSRWFLRQNLPQNLAEMVKWRGRPQSKYPDSSTYSDFADQVDACFDWELSTEGLKLMLAESIAPDYIFINHRVDGLPGEWETPPLDWDPANQLSPGILFDLRMSDLTTTASDHLWGGELGRQRKRKRRQNKITAEPKELVVGIDLKIRSLIPLPRDAELRDVSRRNAGLDETNETILIAAFVATRTLLGGADRIIEWGLMMTLFPDMALSAMRRFWSRARKDRGAFISQLTERFQIQFIAAYEKNQFPPIDFDNYVDYDWPRVIKWTAGLIEDSMELPTSKAALEEDYLLGSAWTDVNNWRDDYYNFQMSVFNRFEAATSRPATCLVDLDTDPVHKPVADDLVTAMSWLRSLCYTPPDRYAPQDIRKKMASIGGGNEERIQSLLEQAVETLQGQGVITDSKLKALEGRPYRLTETFLPRFMKWTHEIKFVDAARFKSRLDGSFCRGEKIRIPYVLKDGEVMAMMNLQASGRVVVTTVDVPNIPLGFDPGNYESRKYPKSYYNFGLEIAPTETYLYNEDLDILRQAKGDKPPRENDNRAIPLWSDFFGDLNIDRWSQVLGAVSFVVATRGPLDVRSACAVLKPYLQEFEVQMVFDWGRRNGVLRGMSIGASCTVDEWWWLLIGHQRAAL
ncbi:hypothetical protein CCHL11_09440 [Colletotrichum chlorophyti]|uniref:C2H2-type domain-containing protein n=1 Tax=Colletotrichum chlorophyti TaxID=708187 RepID=A0A1Q8S1Z8_9PEZI|nr:hypothetical protein CCHL11_09440 [Colletotrichum chlorophyti]